MKKIFAFLFFITIFFSCTKQTAQKALEQNVFVGGLDSSNPETAQDTIQELFFTVYQVKQGDMISTLAEQFGLTQDTLISVNGIRNSRLLQVGQYLRIPTMTGITYTVKKQDETIQSIAQKYKVSHQKTAHVNKIDFDSPLTQGQILFIPDAQMDWTERQEINGDLFTKPIRKYFYYSSSYGWRQNPFTEQRTFHNGIDLVASFGTPIYAALEGTVVFAGWENSFGNCVIIAHHSGYRTLYGHMSAISVKYGQRVTTATKVGELGNTGLSTGPHLHFSATKYGNPVNPRTLW